MAVAAVETGVQSAKLTESGTFVFESEPRPDPAAGEVLVEVSHVGICGSDVHFFTDPSFLGEFDWPVSLGHEAAGRVVETGDGVTGVAVGDRVAIEPGVPCGDCRFCRTGEYHLCRDVTFMADPPVPGAFREVVAWPASHVYPLPEGTSLVEGAMCEPLSVGLHVCHRGEVSVGDAVLVTGCGPIGMFAMDVARAHGATTVAAADVVPEKLDRARERGADVAIDSRERDPAAAVRDAVDELGVDVVVETAGAESAVRSAVDAVRPGGTVVQVGFPHGDVSLPLLDVVEKDADVRGSFRYRNTYPTALDLVAGGDVDAAGLVDFEVPFAEVQDAFQRVVDDPTAVKGVVRVDE